MRFAIIITNLKLGGVFKLAQRYSEDDYCDLYEKKICDNCGKCLEAEGIDTKAIKIEDIAKDVIENKLLEEEYIRELKSKEDEHEDAFEFPSSEELKEAYNKFKDDTGLLDSDEEYEDAFDHIEYLEEVDLFDEGTLEEMTVEIAPGLRKFKGNK